MTKTLGLTVPIPTQNVGTLTFTATAPAPAPVPESTTWAMLMFGLMGVAATKAVRCQG